MIISELPKKSSSPKTEIPVDTDSTKPQEMQQIEYDIPKEAVEVILQIAQRQTASFHSGPLPRAVDYKEYDLVNPGSAERILKMAEERQSADITREKKAGFSRYIWNCFRSDHHMEHDRLGRVFSVSC